MFWRSPSETDLLLDSEIAHALRSLANHPVGSKEYQEIVDIIVKLRAMQNQKSSVSKDTIAMIGGNLAGILMILRFERFDAITSKAMGLLMKVR